VSAAAVESSARNDPIGLDPLTSPVVAYLERLHARYAAVDDGAVATYIPELAQADPKWFGICLVTMDGHVYEVGDTREPFTIQSISKPLTYGIALEECGEALVRERIGVEPTGDPFNAITLDKDTGRPLNPMVNAGAVATVALVAQRHGLGALDRILDVFSRYVGDAREVDWAVYESEATTGYRNRAIGHLLRNAEAIDGEPDPIVDLYFKQCSIAVDCRDLGVIAATIANGGLNPVTGERAVSTDVARSLLSVMTTCGMYDAAGEWLFSVGLPAKSGVSGGLLAVLPGRLGIGVFSPPLDGRGNSVRGVAVCRELSRDLNFHVVGCDPVGVSPIRRRYSPDESGSKRVRSHHERVLIAARSQRARVYELQGDLGFHAAELVLRTIVDDAGGAEVVLLDLRHVNWVGPGVGALFGDLVAAIRRRGGSVGVSGADACADFVRALEEAETGPLQTFAELDLGLEWCEERLLGSDGKPGVAAVVLGEHELLRGLAPAQLDRLQPLLRRRVFERGALIARKGDRAREIYLVTEGKLSVVVERPDGATRRLATLGAGTVFGELAAVGGEARTADVRADTAVECYELALDDLDRLDDTDPSLRSAVLTSLLHIVTRLARRLDDELTLLRA
jgi:glutaminase